jgi:phage shock protein A
MAEIAVVLLRLVVWVGLPILLVALAVGPARSARLVSRAWAWLTDRRQEPAEVLNRVVKEQEKSIAAVREALRQAESTQAEIARNLKRGEENVTALEAEARACARADDDLGARAALHKLNLERLAAAGFRDQLQQHKGRIDESRRRLHLLELQLRQYEVGRSILLSQLAEARTVEQQYALASQFDPYNAVADWHRAEGEVRQAAQSARAAEQVFADTADLPLGGRPVRIDPALIDAQLAELKAQAHRSDNNRRP